MKRLLLFTAFLCSPAFAENLPIRWLEAGKENELFFLHPPEADWSLRFEHRILDQGRFVDASRISGAGERAFKIKAPPLRPGITLKAKLFFGDTPRYDIVIAPPDPFEDREEWFARHPIALYDPEETTAKFFEKEEIPFQLLRSFADIEAVEKAVVVVGQDVDFEKEKGLAELLLLKAVDGGSVLVASPKGSVPLDLPLEYHPQIYSLTLGTSTKHLFPLASRPVGGVRWALHANGDQLVLAHNDAIGPQRAKVLGFGPSMLDIRFADKTKVFSPIGPTPLGRIVFDKNLVFFHDEFVPRVFIHDIETRYYFKSLIETLTNE